MEHKSFEDMRCSVAQCLQLVGEWWTLLLIRDAFRGVHRFDDFQARLGIARNVLTRRLTKLVEAGVLEKRPYQEHPVRYDYLLTDKGRDLWPVVTSMRQWGDRHAAPDGPPLRIVHRGCGQTLELVPTCTGCGDEVSAADARFEPGPGAERKVKATPRRTSRHR